MHNKPKYFKHPTISFCREYCYGEKEMWIASKTTVFSVILLNKILMFTIAVKHKQTKNTLFCSLKLGLG